MTIMGSVYPVDYEIEIDNDSPTVWAMLSVDG